jgi:hypothetical protein
MFALKKRSRLHEVRRYLWRVIDHSTPNLHSLAVNSRSSNRYHRTLPVLVVPCPHRQPDVDAAFCAITKDISDSGLNLILPRRCPTRRAVIGIWYVTEQDPPEDSEPAFVTGLIRRCIDMGGGFWQAGVELTDIFDDQAHVGLLKPRAVALVPPHLWTEQQIRKNVQALAGIL